MTTERISTEDRMINAVSDYLREIGKEGHTAAEQCICFKDGVIWTLTLYRIPDDAVAMLTDHATARNAALQKENTTLKAALEAALQETNTQT